MQKPYFSVLKNGFCLLARSAYWPENTVNKLEIQPWPTFMTPPAGAGLGQKVASPAGASVDP